ncbi:MAG: metal-dependent hydrolase [Ketobacteraceae bacterium]|nr:metal-dependent hydrolase [Ketobacteraceae bacterium]
MASAPSVALQAQSATCSATAREAIPVRRMDFEFDDDIPKYWFGGDPLRTMILTALSCTFPEGERMFMRSVRHYEPGLKDPVLRQQVKGFIGQEAHHGKEHQEFNDMMGRKGLPTAHLETFTRENIAREEALFSPARMLAKTCALEHFTAMFAETLLEYPELIDDIDERLKPLWIWHAIEESEHKSVAYDVYQDQVGSYWIRTSEMALTSVLFTLFSALHTRELLVADRRQAKARKETPPRASVSKALRGAWKNRHILNKLGRHYLSYYRPDFHPSQKDSDFLRHKGLKMLEKRIGAKAQGRANAVSS